MDETCFRFDMDTGKKLDLVGYNHVKDIETVSAGHNFTMNVRVSRGRSGTIEPPFMIFQNKNGNYSNKRTPDDVPGINYLSRPKGWMEKKVMALMLQEHRFVRRPTYLLR